MELRHSSVGRMAQCFLTNPSRAPSSPLPSKKIILVANTAWNLWNYRRSLIQRLEQTDYEIVLLAPKDGFEARLLSGSRARFIPLFHLSRRSFSSIQNLRALLELRQVFQTEQPDLILLFTIKPNILGNVAARMLGLKTLSVVEGLGYSGSHAARWRWLAAPLYRSALLGAQKVVFLNKDDAKEFLAHRLVSEKQFGLIPGPGIDLDYFQATEKTEPNLVFLFCGRLLQEKGIRAFVSAAKQIKHSHPEVIFQVLGGPDPGNPSSVTKEELEIWKQENAVHFLGIAEDVRPQLAGADVLVLPSFYREGVPRSVLEGMAMEKIIITTDTPGCRDTVEEGKNGFLIPPRRPEALVEAMRKVLTLSPEARRQMSAYSRQKAAVEFSDAQVLPKFLELIGQVLKPG